MWSKAFKSLILRILDLICCCKFQKEVMFRNLVKYLDLIKWKCEIKHSVYDKIKDPILRMASAATHFIWFKRL
jgi:hypothetical protein